MTHSPVLLALDALATYRLTRLVTVDVLTEPLRRWLIGTVTLSERNLDGSKILVGARGRLAEFLHCPWCVSVWSAVAVVLTQALAPGAALYLSAVLALSALAGIISERV